MTATPQPLPRGRARGLALAVLCAATLMIILDGTIVTVALPSIQRDLVLPQASLTWVMNAYLIAFSGALLLAGRIGDLLGRKRVMLWGLAAFTAASLLCGLSGDVPLLIGARFAQGVGGAMIAAVSLGMITTLYPEPAERARAIGAYSFVGAAGASIGLILGGVLTELLSWHWIFYVNVPIGVLALAASARLLPAGQREARRGGADVSGALLVTAGLMIGVYTIVGTSEPGWSAARTAGLAAVTVALLAAFVLRQAKAASPLLPLRILTARDIGPANLAQVLAIAAAFGFQIVITLYMRRVLGYSPAATGLGLLPTAVVIGTVSLAVSARLSQRFGARAVLMTGLALVATGLGLLTRLPDHGSYAVRLLPVMVVFGVGGGLTLPSLATLAMAGVGPSDAGVASGLFNTTQQAGAALGVALMSTLAAARADRGLADGVAPASALAGGYRLAFAVGAGLAVLALAVAATRLRRSPDGRSRDRANASAMTRPGPGRAPRAGSSPAAPGHS